MWTIETHFPGEPDPIISNGHSTVEAQEVILDDLCILAVEDRHAPAIVSSLINGGEGNTVKVNGGTITTTRRIIGY